MFLEIPQNYHRHFDESINDFKKKQEQHILINLNLVTYIRSLESMYWQGNNIQIHFGEEHTTTCALTLDEFNKYIEIKKTKLGKIL